MPARPSATDPAATKSAPARARNEVALQGRVAAPPEERTLPSGDSLMTARLIIDRNASAREHSAQRVDTIDCVAWTARVQRSMRSWQPGDEVLIAGSIRRRFYRGASGPVSRVEVEIHQARRTSRAS